MVPHDHGPIEVVLDAKLFNAPAKIVNMQKDFPMGNDCPEETMFIDIWRQEFATQKSNFDKGNRGNDPEVMHQARTRAAVGYLRRITGTAGGIRYNHAEERANKPTFDARTVCCRPDPLSHEATAHRERSLINFHSRMSEMSITVTRQEDREQKGESTSPEAKLQTEKLWHNICKALLAVLPFKKVIRGFEWGETARPMPTRSRRPQMWHGACLRRKLSRLEIVEAESS